MKMEKQETVADIIVEMRDLGKLDEKSVDKIPRTLMALGLRTYADRLEAAFGREKAAIEADALAVGGMVDASRKQKPTAENSSAVGDCAKLREAVEKCRHVIHCAIVSGILKGDDAYDAMNIASSALAASRTTTENSSAVGDAAAKQEAVTDSHGLGNNAKLREALQQAKVAILAARKKMGVDNPIILEIIDAALAEPVRNCEVGTAEEQFERWQAFCDRYDRNCTGCPCKSPHTFAYCFAKWGQMPYKEGGAK